MIYFAQLPTSAVKIGCSENVPARLDQLRAHYGEEPALLHTMDGGRDVEAALHERFAAHRLGRTEQFRPAPELMAFIGRPLLVGPNPDAVEAMPPELAPRRTVLTIKGTDEWRGWLERLGKFLRTPTSTIVDHALVKYAQDRGFTEEAPER